jgi:hypothetical protein
MATDRNALELTPSSSDTVADFFTEYDANMQIIDNAIAKCNFTAVADPTANEDSGDGYAAGTLWFNVTGHKLFICEAATVGAEVWRQIWPVTSVGANVDFGAYDVRGATLTSDVATGTIPVNVASTTKCTDLNADLLDGLHDTAFVKSAGTVALSANWDAGSYKITALQFESDQATGTAPLVVASTTKVDNLNVSALEGHAASYFVASGAPEIWRTFPGTPTRVSDSQFTITDAGGANSYAATFPKGTVIKWEKSGGGFQCAMIKASAYDSDVVTIDILGNDLVAGFTTMKYSLLPAEMDVFIVPGKLPAAASTDIGKTIYWPEDRLVFSAIIRYKTAATTTKGVWDVNDDGTSIFTTKPEIAATATVGADQISDCILDTALTVVAAGSLVTLDYDGGHATTPGSDAYAVLYSMPYSWRYRA